jgi:hypothetical protein
MKVTVFWNVISCSLVDLYIYTKLHGVRSHKAVIFVD